MAHDHGPFYLKLYDRNGLVHPGCQTGIHSIIDIFIQYFRHKTFTGVILVHSGRKHGQRAQVYAIAVLQHIKAVVADGNPQNVADTGQIAGSRSHP